ncbi:DUF3052 family protein [Sphingosinithalassobacter portus]|uniref:DUF3052 family protein n=1 Tax=Stakelama portus TaxID=2676234 RepID=UPI000D6E1EB7|nr:DUF3052 family protein [Sphingosinithalassobacter portus]
MTTAGLNTPLAQQLGLSRGMRSWFCHMPDHLRDAITPEAIGIEEQSTASDGMQAAIIFVTDRADLTRKLTALRPLLQPKGFIWAVWPEHGDIETDITADAVRESAEPAGLLHDAQLDLDNIWSGLKLVLHPAHR